MGAEKLIDGEVPNIMENREEEGKWKNKRKRKGRGGGGGGKHPAILLLYFSVPVFCRMSLGNQFILIREFKCTNCTSCTFICWCHYCARARPVVSKRFSSCTSISKTFVSVHP